MPDYFESGMFLIQPAWHRKGNVVEDWPGDWETTRKGAGLTWDIDIVPAGMRYGWHDFVPDEDAVYLLRNDKPATLRTEDGEGNERLIVNQAAKLAIQPLSYAVITNAAFGELIESIVGEIGRDFAFETLISIKGGKQIIALMRSRQPLRIDGDFSATYTYLAFIIRHDGQGGFRCIPTNVRIVCANTVQAAEHFARQAGVGWTIRHTANWETRVADLQAAVAGAVRSSEVWEKLSNKMILTVVSGAEQETFLRAQLPIHDGMTERQQKSINRARDMVRANWGSPTCEQLGRNVYQMLMGFTQYLDHGRRSLSTDSEIARALMVPQDAKTKAISYCRKAYDLAA
jgi:phage/plasmid-like protein (TIGR03299 family)